VRVRITSGLKPPLDGDARLLDATAFNRVGTERDRKKNQATVVAACNA
jgi:hypothetical protein